MAGSAAGGFVTRAFESMLKECIKVRKYDALQSAIQACLDSGKDLNQQSSIGETKEALSEVPNRSLSEPDARVEETEVGDGPSIRNPSVPEEVERPTKCTESNTVVLAKTGHTLGEAEAELVLNPLRLAFETKNIKIVELALDCLHKLVEYNHLEGDPGLDGAKNALLFADILNMACSAVDNSSPDSTLLQVLKVLTAIASANRESIFRSALATPKHNEQPMPPPQPLEPVADLTSSAADPPTSETQGNRPSSRPPSQEFPKTKRHKSSKGGEAPLNKKKKSSTKDACSQPVLEQPKSFAGNVDINSSAAYLLSIFPEGETSCWKDSKTRASVTLFNLVKALAGLAPILHEGIEGSSEAETLQNERDTARTELASLKEAYDREKKENDQLTAQLRSREIEVVTLNNQLHSKESELASLQLSVDQRVALARSDGEASFLSSIRGTRFLEHYRADLLKHYEHTTHFLTKLSPACIQYFIEGVQRTFEQVKARGYNGSVDAAAMLPGLPEPTGWNGDRAQLTDFPWWEPVVDAAKAKAWLASD